MKISRHISSRSSPNNSAGAALTKRFPDAAGFLEAYNPSRQARYTADLTRAYLGKAPQLSEIAHAYGHGTVETWLQIQIHDLSKFSGCRDKLSISQLEQMGELILSEYSWLKTTELMHFFRLCKLGEFGKLFYGTVDPIAILDALKQYRSRRNSILEDLQRRKQSDNNRHELKVQDDARQIYDRMLPTEYHPLISRSQFMRLGYDRLSPDELTLRLSTGQYKTDISQLPPLGK